MLVLYSSYSYIELVPLLAQHLQKGHDFWVSFNVILW